MPFVQRDEGGLIIGRYANLQPGFAEEWLDGDEPEIDALNAAQLVTAEREWRDRALSDVRWLRERHRDELDLVRETTLSAGQFAELLSYLQDLRDWPQSEHFPVIEDRPVCPPWIVQQDL
ncbi:hypothetical protein K3F44_18145 [Pseudomonas sp. S07E 245]|uniref:phage tail assembly chaperone n=1 Tax=Pseudomonas sp. S07E 245 TaxID=2866278 RepID=UPI001C72B3B2|nr:phage tail assembly chaperone [Pseudomonas sp. S07E 245]QYX51513.1 hypothetical protein K3F44_18145 [Pseudomonas sp. S07E 245]